MEFYDFIRRCELILIFYIIDPSALREYPIPSSPSTLLRGPIRFINLEEYSASNQGTIAGLLKRNKLTSPQGLR